MVIKSRDLIVASRPLISHLRSFFSQRGDQPSNNIPPQPQNHRVPPGILPYYPLVIRRQPVLLIRDLQLAATHPQHLTMTPTASASSPAVPSKSQTKHIANPRRLLVLTPTSQSLSIIPPLLHSLTGVPVTNPPQHDSTTETSSQTPPQPSENASTPTITTTATSFAGYTTHSPLRLDTKYYSAEIPLWVDEIPSQPTPP